MAMFHPVPTKGGSLEKKLHYFYRPYNYNINTQKFMKFEEEPQPEIVEEHKAIEPYWNNM